MLFTAMPAFLFSQGANTIMTQTETLLYADEGGEFPADIHEKYADLLAHPIDLNSAKRDQLTESGLFTPFQIEVLLRYRSEYGPLFSINELAALSGFRNFRLKEKAPCLTVGTGNSFEPYDPWNLMVLVHGKRSFPDAAGYDPGDSASGVAAYAGSPLKTGFRLRADYSGILFAGVGFEKDPGEQFIHQGKPEFLTGYILYRGSRKIRKLLLGNYRIQHGLGIVNGTGFMPSLETMSLHTPFSAKIVPYAGLGESKFERGAGCQLSWGNSDLILWGSYRTMDLSLHDINEFPANIDWEEAARTTGMHRTRSEVAGRGLAFRIHQGLVFSLRVNHLSIGTSFGLRSGGLTGRGKDSLRLDPGLSHHLVGSLHGAWYTERIELAWELAATGSRSVAFLTGIRVHLNDFLQGVLLIHRYGNQYRGIYPSSYASGSHHRNDKGVALGWHIEAGRFFVGDLTMELFTFPAPTYRAALPSGGRRLGLSVRNPGTRELNWRFRIYEKRWQSTPEKEAKGIPATKSSRLIRSEVGFDFLPGRGRYGKPEQSVAPSLSTRRTVGELNLKPLELRWQSRLILSWLQGQPVSRPDFAVDQRMTLRCGSSFRSTLQLVVFNVTAWDNRIYLYEPGLYYSFNFPLCHGSGEKITAVIALKTGKKLTLSGKLGTVIYHDRDYTGTGMERREGNQQWEMELQLRLRL
jgi:hypothetical protein